MKSDYHQNQNAMKDKSKIGKYDKKLDRDYTKEDWDLEHGKKGKYNPASYYNCPPGQTYNTVDQKCE